MGDFSPLLTALWGVLVIFVVLLSARVVLERRRVAVENVPAPARRSHGRHCAAAPAASGVRILRHVPIEMRRRRSSVDQAPPLVSAPAEADGEVAVVEEPVALEVNAPATAVPDPPSTGSGDVHGYRRRVEATIRVMSRRIGPGESPELLEARLLAALDRLDGPLSFSRPRLSPAGPHHPAEQLAQIPPATPPSSTAQLPSGERALDPPVDATPFEAGSPAKSPDAVPATAEEQVPEKAVRDEVSVLEADEVVLPVPPLESSVDVRRRGLRRRREVG